MEFSLKKFKDTRIPSLQNARTIRPTYCDIPIQTTGELYSEPYFDIRDSGIAGDNFYHRSDNPPYFMQIPHSIPDLFLRKTVIEKLVRINAKLRTEGLELYAFDCYRPIEVQNYFHDVWFHDYVAKKHPDWTEEEIVKEVEVYWARGSAVIDPLCPPPHSTGGALDVTIRRISTKEHLYMGTMFDDMDVRAFTDFYESHEPVSFSDEEAQKNRRLLYWLMDEEGFANNCTEWWHYSWGDQMWALFSGQKTANYSNLKM